VSGHDYGHGTAGTIGLAGNAVGLIVLTSGRNHNFNMRAAFLEVLV
jgi:cobalt-zinc-cadmium efflux system protein